MSQDPLRQPGFAPLAQAAPARVTAGIGMPMNVGRPESVSAVCGMGIAVGIFSILASLIIAGVAAGFTAVSSSTAQKIKQFAPPALPVSLPEQPVTLALPLAQAETGAQGLPIDQRNAVVAMIGRVIPLSPQHGQQLDALLREAGQVVFPGRVPSSDAAMDAALKDHRILPAVSPDAPPTVLLATAGGRAQIRADGAVFYPNDGSATVRIGSGPRFNSTNHPVLRPQDVDAVVGIIRQSLGDKLKPAQAATLAGLLRSPDQQLVALTGPADAPTLGIAGAAPQANDYVLIGFGGGSMVLAPDGRVVFANDPLPGVSGLSLSCVLAESLASVALAIWLIVLSNRLMKQRIMTPRHHRRWARAKIVLSILGGAAFAWLLASFMSLTSSSAARAGSMGMLAGAVVVAAGCAFPVAVLILLSRPRAKLYFDGVM